MYRNKYLFRATMHMLYGTVTPKTVTTTSSSSSCRLFSLDFHHPRERAALWYLRQQRKEVGRSFPERDLFSLPCSSLQIATLQHQWFQLFATDGSNDPFKYQKRKRIYTNQVYKQQLQKEMQEMRPSEFLLLSQFLLWLP